MKQFIIPIIAGVVGVIMPIAGMTITPTRNFILGLAPDEAVLQLADKIDENRINYDARLAENDQKIEELKNSITEQSKIIDDQKKAIETQNKEVVSVNTKINTTSTDQERQKKCLELMRKEEANYCGNEAYSSQKAFDKHIEDLNEKSENGMSMEKFIEKAKRVWNVCKEINKYCD